MEKNKTWTLQVNNQPFKISLAPPNQRGCCSGCLRKKEIRIISQQSHFKFRRKFCRFCALEKLSKLVDSNYSVKPKEVIKEVRSSLVFGR